MKKFKNILTAFLVLVALGSYGQTDLVCVELSFEGESIILPMSAEEVDQLADSGLEYAITDCPEDFDFGGEDFGDDFDGDFGDDFDGDFGDFGDFSFDEFICVEVTVEGETCIIPVVEEMLADLDAEGLDYTIVDCEGLVDYDNDFGDWEEDFDWDEDYDYGDDFGDWDENFDWDEDYDYGDDFGDWENDYVFEDFICVELTVEGETCIIPVVEEMLADLDAEGLEYTVVDCDGLGDYDDNYGDDFGDWDEDFDWDNDFGDWDEDFDWDEDYDYGNDFGDWGDEGDFGDFTTEDFICVEVSYEGQVCVIPMLEEMLADLDAEGTEYTVVDCDGVFDYEGDLGDWENDEDFGDFDFGDIEDFDFGNNICVEVSEEGESFVISLPEEMLELLELEGLEYAVVDCDGIDGEGSSDSNTDGFGEFNNYGVSDLALYPNPVDNDGIITVNFDSNSEFTSVVSVTNQLGQVVNSIQLTAQKGNNNLQIESASLDSGIYFISIENSNKVYTERVVVK